MRRRMTTLLATAVAMSVMALPAQASTTQAVADTGGMTLTLDVLGSPLAIAVSLDDVGHITEVTVSDSAFEPTAAGDHKVRFTDATSGTRIDIKAKNSKLSAAVKASDLASLIGTHEWKGALFASEQETTVSFGVADDGSGNPILHDVVVAELNPADAVAEVGDIHSGTDDEGEAESSVKVDFLWNGYTMTLKVEVSAESGDGDHDGGDDLSSDAVDHFTLKVELKGKDRQILREELLSNLLGEYAWVGRLCDGTEVTVSYTVAEPGTVQLGTVTIGGVPSDAFRLDTRDHGFQVRFDDSKAKLSVDLKQDDGVWVLKTRSKTTETCDQHSDDHEVGDDHHDGDRLKAKDDSDGSVKDDRRDDDHGGDDD